MSFLLPCGAGPCSKASHTETFCFLRLLLQLAQSQQTSFALEKNLRTQQEIAGKVKEFNFRDDTLLLVEEVRIPSELCGAASQSFCAVPIPKECQTSSHPEGPLSLSHCVPLGFPSHQSGPPSFTCCISAFLFLFSSVLIN